MTDDGKNPNVEKQGVPRQFACAACGEPLLGSVWADERGLFHASATCIRGIAEPLFFSIPHGVPTAIDIPVGWQRFDYKWVSLPSRSSVRYTTTRSLLYTTTKSLLVEQHSGTPQNFMIWERT